MPRVEESKVEPTCASVKISDAQQVRWTMNMPDPCFPTRQLIDRMEQSHLECGMIGYSLYLTWTRVTFV